MRMVVPVAWGIEFPQMAHHPVTGVLKIERFGNFAGTERRSRRSYSLLGASPSMPPDRWCSGW
jgi:hypothetical protein